jgi:hypothetical protein
MDVEKLIACIFANHIYGTRPTQTTQIDMLYWNCGQKLHPTRIQSASHFNKQCKSSLCQSQWLCGLRQRSWPPGSWHHKFESHFGQSQNDSAGMTCFKNASLYTLGNFPGSQLPSMLHSKLYLARTPRPSAFLTHAEWSLRTAAQMKPMSEIPFGILVHRVHQTNFTIPTLPVSRGNPTWRGGIHVTTQSSE